MKTLEQNTWIDDNQRFLVAEFARLEALLGAGDPVTAEPNSESNSESIRASLNRPPAIDTLAKLFGLSEFERDVVLLVAGAEMDSTLATMCGEAQEQPSRPWATFGVALASLPNPHWTALTPAGPLRRWKLIEIDERSGILTARLQIDERILHYISGTGCTDPRLQPLLRFLALPRLAADSHKAVAAEIARSIGGGSDSLPIVHLHGDDPPGQEDVAALVAQQLGVGIFVLRDEDLPTSPHELEVVASLWQREAALSGNVLMVIHTEGSDRILERFVGRVGSLVFVSSRQLIHFERPSLRFAVDKPGVPEQRRLWATALGATADRLDGELDAVVGNFRLSARTIDTTAARISDELQESETPGPVFRQFCRNLEVVRMGSMAQRVELIADWDDLILPPSQKTALRQISSHARFRLKVYHDWGFAARSNRGLGISALFCGESGTGKTMAAEVIAKDLQLDLYRIDLSAVVSKYIGETEKNLRRVFDAAEQTGAILLFDEADALFGKRSEVKDSHDRYANLEISYLLQKMEVHRGLAILTTNQKKALDSAFQRRLRFVVQFPFPDSEAREAIWRGIFPAEVPVDSVDAAKLAKLNMSGGSIRNIGLNAAFSAAEAGTPVNMSHLLGAAHAEAAKREIPIAEAETRGWV